MEREPCIPRKYGPEYFARLIHTEDVEDIDRYLLAMTRIGLISFTADFRIIVRGVRKNHPRLQWKFPEPQTHMNPWVTHGPDYTWKPLEIDSPPVAEPYPPCSLPLEGPKETETETETETEKKARIVSLDKKQKLDRLFERWNILAKRAGLRIARTLGKGKRRAAASARLDEKEWSDNYLSAMYCIKKSDFCKGTLPNKPWKANLDWFLRPDTVTKILEGQYDNPPTLKGAHTSDDLPF